MQNDDIYKFLTAKCKEKNIRVEKLPELCGFSRSTLYRYMKGILRMSSEAEAIFSRVLQLDAAEKLEFSRLAALTAFDSTIVASRYVLDELVFGKSAEPAPAHKAVQFAYYDNDKYLRTAEEIFETILRQAKDSEVSCDIKIVNCLDHGIFSGVSSFLQAIFSIPACDAEHLLTFSERDYLRNTNILINILPLLLFKNYRVFYNNSEASEPVKMLFNDMILIKLGGAGFDRYYFISFLDEKLSECIAFTDEYFYNFLYNNYLAYKKNYKSALRELQGMDMFSKEIMELEKQNDCYLIKPNNCFNKIPIHAYKSMLERSPASESASFIRAMADVSADLECDELLENMFDVLGKRISYSYQRQQIDVYCKSGLIELARAGTITDHLDFMPPFDRRERKSILEYIRDRSNDPEDKYMLYVTEDNIFDNGYIIVAYDGLGILVEYNREDYRRGVCYNMFIKSKMLAEVFTDYVKNHIPVNRALSKEEATQFINSLIKELEE